MRVFLMTLGSLISLMTLRSLRSLKSLITLIPLRSLPLFLVLASLSSCEREPMLHLVDPDEEPIDVDFQTDKIILDLDVLWEYELSYEWQLDWFYGWDESDNDIFGDWDLKEPNVFNIRRYYTYEDSLAAHTAPLKNQITGKRFQDKYKYGYYDILVWNEVETLDGVQSLVYDEESTYEYVTAYTHQSTVQTSRPPFTPQETRALGAYRSGYAFYQPEFLFSGHYENLHVSDDPADYDSLIVETNTWYKFVPMVLTPVTYIYLPQVIIHHNRGKIDNVVGSATLTGMARSVNLLTHVTDREDISTSHSIRMKKHKQIPADMGNPDNGETEDVDIAGGRVMTFGLTGVDPYHVTRSSSDYSQILESEVRNYIEVDFLFNNGRDSLFFFDVTDQVKERYKGGVLTVHIDMDTIPIPGAGGGSMFDAKVEDYEEETHEFDM